MRSYYYSLDKKLINNKVVICNNIFALTNNTMAMIMLQVGI